jgi:alkyl sulfatase
LKYLSYSQGFGCCESMIIPPCGGDTIWANTVAAYEHLPEPLRALADGLRCVHTNAADAAASVEFADEAARLHEEEFTSTIFETEHPVVRLHPETGERALLLGGFAQRVLSLSGPESRAVIAMLQHRVPTPRTPYVGAGTKATWRCGTTARPSTTPSTTTETFTAS